ncbi:MAG: sugar phosphate isomerase/epimerase family protein [Candidatus Nitrospinota bacterium M3_3B_026]
MLGISTCWRSRSITDGAALARETLELGAKAVELDFRLAPETLAGLLKELKKADVPPVSIHGICPAPQYKKNPQAAEAFDLSADDEQERRKAAGDAAATLRLAGEVGARAVVLHLGSVPMERAEPELRRLCDRGLIRAPEGQRIINELRIKRLRSRGATFDRLLKSLEEIAGEAEKLKVLVGLENRYHMSEYPAYEELAVIFHRFSGSFLRYWHDTGHATAQENMGVTPGDAYLRDFGDVLAGVHLHDVDGYTDHLAPPAGGREGVDFESLRKHLKPDTIKILELGPGVPAEDARRSLEWLSERGF